MIGKKLFVSFVAASLVVGPVQRAQANDAAAVLGGLIVGGLIVNEVNKNKARQNAAAAQAARNRSSVSSAQRQQNRDVQTALNYFGYNVGTVDGSLGRKSREGISRYQGQMGFQPDGTLDEYERDFLLGSHQRALASAHVPPYNQIMASQGQQGLLRTYRNEQLGIPTPNLQTAAATAPTAAPQGGVPQATQPTPVPARADPPALPDFSVGQVARSVNAHCNEISLLTAANGGLTAASQVKDTEFALNEQFCLARTHAMSESSGIVATIPNMTDAQIELQCDGLSKAIEPHMADLATSRPDQVIAATGAFLQGSGRPMPQLISGGKICLGVGYRTDNPQMALASAVLLTSAGQLGYGEMVSHHLREGFGTTQAQKPQSDAWIQLTLNALDSGNPGVLGQSADRVAVLKSAMGGGAPAGVAALPVFPTAGN